MSRYALITSLFLLSTGIAAAQETKPYAGQQDREIKALSTQEVRDYLDGKGMGLAKTAELNHYPGPAHVLELADKLQLTAEQKAETQELFAAMAREAQAFGKALIQKERELDRLFASGTVDEITLAACLHDIGLLQADVRRTHLQAHLAQRRILTPQQIARYDALRGYGGHASAQPDRSHHH